MPFGGKSDCKYLLLVEMDELLDTDELLLTLVLVGVETLVELLLVLVETLK